MLKSFEIVSYFSFPICIDDEAAAVKQLVGLFFTRKSNLAEI